MPDELKPLKPKDEVYIKSLSMLGSVLRVRPGDVREPEKDRLYEVQFTRYFRRTDLELDDREAERQKRESDLRMKTERLAAARKNVEEITARGCDVKAGAALEFLFAADDLWQALGHDPLLVPIKKG